jgi:hypothetical protein
MKKFYFFILLLVLLNCSSSENRNSNLIKLNSGTESEKISACTYFGKESKDKSVLKDIFEIIKKSESKSVQISCINALGYIAENGDSETTLKNKIFSESNSDIVYSSLYSLYSISLKNGVTGEAKSAIQYADVHHRSDYHTADLIDKIKQYYFSKEK